MNRLRNKLILIFLAATVVPWGATLWITTSLLDHSLRYRSTRELDDISRSLQKTGHEFYRQAREELRSSALAGRTAPQHYAERDLEHWPEVVKTFWASPDTERFVRARVTRPRLR